MEIRLGTLEDVEWLARGQFAIEAIEEGAGYVAPPLETETPVARLRVLNERVLVAEVRGALGCGTGGCGAAWRLQWRLVVPGVLGRRLRWFSGGVCGEI